MRIFLILISGLFLAASAFAGGDGHGGGGVYRDGQYVTFYSAGIYISSTALEITGPNKVPELKELVKYIGQTPYLSDTTKATLINALEPSMNRKYYEVDRWRFTKKELAEIKAQYGNAMQIDAQHVHLYAVTDPANDATYLLPDYYKLSQVDQEAILYHEAYWILHPTSNYTTVIESESAFEAFLENPYSSTNIMNWLATVGTTADELKAAIQFDLNTGALGGLLVNQNQIPLEKLFGKQFFKCKEDEHKRGQGLNCTSDIEVHLTQLSQQYPSSALIPFLRSEFAADAVVISVTQNADSRTKFVDPGNSENEGKLPEVAIIKSGGNLCERLSRNYVGECYGYRPFELGYLNLNDSSGAMLSLSLTLWPGQVASSVDNYYFQLTN